MNNLHSQILTGVLFSLALASALPATAQSNSSENCGFYVKADVGGQWTLDTSLKDFFGSASAGSEVKFSPGPRVAFTGGYQITDWFAAEAQVGSMINKIDSITDADHVGDSFFSNVPLLVNARFQWPSQCPITPYIGGGLGTSITMLDADDLSIGGTTVDGGAVDAVFAYQGFGGVRYRLNDNMGLSLEYHYVATADSSWDAEDISGRVRFDGTQTHAVTIAFDYKF